MAPGCCSAAQTVNRGEKPRCSRELSENFLRVEIAYQFQSNKISIYSLSWLSQGPKSSQNSPEGIQIRVRYGNSISKDSLKTIQQISISTSSFGGITLHSNWRMRSDGLVHPGAGFLNTTSYRQHRSITQTRKGSGNSFSMLATGHSATRHSSSRSPNRLI